MYKDYVLSPEICIFRKQMKWKIYIKNNYTIQLQLSLSSVIDISYINSRTTQYTHINFQIYFHVEMPNRETPKIELLYCISLCWFDLMSVITIGDTSLRMI